MTSGHHNHFGPTMPIRLTQPRQSHRNIRSSSHQRHFTNNSSRPAKYYYSESESDIFHGTRRSRSTPPNQHHHRHRGGGDMPDFGVFSAHDLHAANERRASRRDLADLRDQLFVRSTNDVRGRTRSSGRDLLDRWQAAQQEEAERAHCEKCNAHMPTLGKPNNHQHHHRQHSVPHLHSGDEFFVPRGGRY